MIIHLAKLSNLDPNMIPNKLMQNLNKYNDKITKNWNNSSDRKTLKIVHFQKK